MAEPPAPPPEPPDLSKIAQAVTVTAVLLPVAGICERFLAFLWGASLNTSALEVAWSAPLSQLVATPIVSLLPWIPFLIIFSSSASWQQDVAANIAVGLELLKRLDTNIKRSEEVTEQIEALSKQTQALAEGAESPEKRREVAALR